MEELQAEIRRLMAALAHYDRVIPGMEPADRARATFHRDWDARILAGYIQALSHA